MDVGKVLMWLGIVAAFATGHFIAGIALAAILVFTVMSDK